jgi:hypothetical protein
MTDLYGRSKSSNKTKQKYLAMGKSTRTHLLAKNLLGATAVVAGILGSALQVNAAIQSKAMNLIRPDKDKLDLIIYYDDVMQFTINSSGNYSAVRPTAATNLPGIFIDTTTADPVPGYDPNGFTGYAITGVTGKYYDGEHDEWYEVKSICPSSAINTPLPGPPVHNSTTFPGCLLPTFGSPADSTNGLFSEGSYTEGIYPFIKHTLSDNLFKPDLVDQKVLKGIFSSGGIVFNTSYLNEAGGYNYQLFSDAANDNELAGCGSGTCEKTIFAVPGPLPLLGVGAAFGYSRTLRKRIKRGQAADILN